MLLASVRDSHRSKKNQHSKQRKRFSHFASPLVFVFLWGIWRILATEEALFCFLLGTIRQTLRIKPFHFLQLVGCLSRQMPDEQDQFPGGLVVGPILLAEGRHSA